MEHFKAVSASYSQRRIVLALITLLSLWLPASSEKILFLLPISSKSMTNVFEPLAKELVEKGHNLTIVAPLRFRSLNESTAQLAPISTEDYVQDYPNPLETRRKKHLFSLSVPFLTKNCHRVAQNPEFTKLANQPFDLIVASAFFHDCFAGFMHKIGSPIVFVGTLPLPTHMTEEMFGNHYPSSTIPFPAYSGNFSHHLDFSHRTINFLYNLYFSGMMDFVWRPPMEVLNRQYFGADTPSILEVYKKQGSLILMNSHFALTGPRPLVPTVVEIGGIHCRAARPVSADLENFIQGAGENGFIIFSLGSIVKVSNLPESVQQAFITAFANLKQRVIWKWETDDGISMNLPGNVRLVKWLPQQDLLGHPNVRLFITHGGLLSTEEAIYHGVPVLGFPVFVDQDHNMRQAENLGVGIKGEILNLTEAKLTPLIRRILDDPQYMVKAKQISTIFRDQPHTPLERAVFWTEYVLRHQGAYHLQSGAIHLNTLQYHSVDVIAFLAVIVINFLMVVYYFVKHLLRLLQWLVFVYKSNFQKPSNRFLRKIKGNNKPKKL